MPYFGAFFSCKNYRSMIYCFGMKKIPSYKNLTKQRNNLLAKLSSTSFILRGSLRKHGNICGNPICRCKHPKNPKPHGPYDYLSHRYDNKTQTIFLNKKKLVYATEGLKEYKKLMKIIYRLSEINFRILRYHYHNLPEKK